MLTLLAEKDLRDKFQEIYNELEAQKNTFITALKKVSSSADCEAEVLNTFVDISKDNFFEILKTTISEIEAQKENYKFKYNDVFDKDGKVKIFIESHKELLVEYTTQYNSIMASSNFFNNSNDKKFGTAQANAILEAIKDDSFFEAGHRLAIEQSSEIKSSAELSELVSDEISKIIENPELKKVFEKIDNALQKNQQLKAFKKVIDDNNTLVSKLLNYENFKKEVWFSYLNQLKTEVAALIDLYEQKKGDLEKISEEAKSKKTFWDNAVEEFNERFVNLPFKLVVKNKQDAILNQKTPAIDFQFKGRQIERNNLLDVLSQGERRAFYLLNIIFEVKSREIQGQRTIFIIDDIADSFNYKNKYAIIEYLNDISKKENFYQIILTHNYDFYRIISSRLYLDRKNKLHAVKTKDHIEIIEEVYQNPPFKTWKDNLKAGTYYHKTFSSEDAKKHIIALIPFVRNLIEFGVDAEVNSHSNIDTDFDLLTQLIHLKPFTRDITLLNLKEIYGRYLGKDDFDPSIDLNEKVYDLIISLAESIQDNEFNLENKIVLAIVIRLKSEEYMWNKVTDKSPFSGSSTGKLFGRYSLEFKEDKSEKNNIKILESVNIMTPENIHINSFMYEPILDMGIEELKNLYTKIPSP